MVNFYEILNIPTHATPMEVERAIRLARQRGDVDEKVLTQARNYLIDPKMRKVYNQKMGIKVKAAPRAGSGLSSSMPFWMPVMVIVGLLVVGAAATQYFLKDAREKRREANQIAQNHQSMQAQQDADGGVVTPQANARIQPWLDSLRIMDLPMPQYGQTSRNLQSDTSAFKSVQLVLALPEDGSFQLALMTDKPLICEDACEVTLVFSEYSRYTFPMNMASGRLTTSVTEGFVQMFSKQGQVLVTLPDADQSEFLFQYPALPPR